MRNKVGIKTGPVLGDKAPPLSLTPDTQVMLLELIQNDSPRWGFVPSLSLPPGGGVLHVPLDSAMRYLCLPCRSGHLWHHPVLHAHLHGAHVHARLPGGMRLHLQEGASQ